MQETLHQPQSGNDMPRFGDLATMTRHPFMEELNGLNVVFIGISLDIGTSQRVGARYDLRHIGEKARAPLVHISFNIDGIDLARGSGTVTPEVGGLTSIQTLETDRSCKGLNSPGADLVEVSPPYNVSSNTSQLAVRNTLRIDCSGVNISHKSVK